MRSIRAALLVACSIALLVGVSSPSLAGKAPHAGQGIQITPEQVVPGPGMMGASATGIISVSRGGVNYVVTIATLNDPITEIALYQGAPGQVGTKVLRLTPSPIGIYQMQATAPCSDALCRDLSRNAANYYVQITTQRYPGGALRGQLH